ncbi:plexin-B1-like [Myxocyprinus asiaticus]|uniref:plexin-B1-like n=1 Tax=Myxocyprinus asiaticus TaxID=70543 RepID=UPI00222157C4|nr:plexin-B1-like [Myxocyprinus asiaticus]XP_051525587.1 plexin-B1-like [Myxocyprinus asiaticus]XP_051525589.1 plexin-B1-like [Myxocyprinus asiaticus]XP_051525590.1 plexin-B1-like [Myxocyprinus asiaticus]XP_051525591.1 plexin-B1-like [Myxocyprinus asiaticus]XP_051525592.1 plexin-B1-like [Myxocyprinus asiaticus]
MPAAAPLLLLLAILWWPLVLPLAHGHPQSSPTFTSLNGSRLNHLLLDNRSGHVYVGAVNVLYHLSPDLQLLSWGKTGPKLDSPDCLPPIDPTDCTHAETTDNTNKLLLLEVEGGHPLSLIVCGTVLQGICEKRSLENVSQVLYKTDNPVDTQYVAANDPRVSTVGVVVEQKGVLLMLVGRGYTSKGPGGIPPITMRRLAPIGQHSAPAFSHEEFGKLVVGSYSEYNNHFVKALRHNNYVYFVFSRRDVWGKREYRTYVSRLCAGDHNFYSYVEVSLSCGGRYNLAQAAVLGMHREQPVLFVAMAMGQASTPTHADRSALCVYKVEELDKALHGAQLLCYTQEGKDSNGKEKAYIEYEVSSSCLKLPQDSLTEYPCGGEHTPSPIASAIPLEATPAFTWTPPITAIATATEVGHTIVLLGDKSGRLHKVFLHANDTGTKYDTVEVDTDSSINADLLLDSTKQNVYVLTERRVTKLQVSQCEMHLDCHSCLSNRDPYCGWCSLEGRCTRKMDCARHAQPHHWIWSYGRERQCVSIENLEPAIQSREQQTRVSFTVVQLPVLSKDESLSCTFGSLAAEPVVVRENRITCQSPAPEELPTSPPGNDHVSVRMELKFGNVTISHTNITFYDCKAVGRLNATSPCMACVSSMWPCHWCVKDELCTHDKSCPRQHAIYNSREQSTPRGPDSCPCVWALQSSPLVPVGFDTEVTLQGKNLDIFEDEEDYACVLVIEGRELRLRATLDRSKETGAHVFKCTAHQFQYSEKQFEYSAPVYLQWGTQRIDSAPHLRLQLYNCSVGQSDCSQCRAVAADYGCVWCGDETPSCLYNQSCTSGTIDTCPPPLITQVEPLTGPLEGGILLTIQGSNLGQSFQDIQAGVTVAGVTCRPLSEAYRISTSIVCELQASANITAGPVVITVRGSDRGESQQTFSYQNPQLSRIMPEKGPLAGGTMLTILGSQLLTGQKTEQRIDQITGLQAFVGLQPCRIDGVSDTRLICRTSYSNQTGNVPVKVLFGRAERIVGTVLFSYMEDPIIIDVTPTESFYGGGRAVYVTGQHLDVVQQPKMSVSYEPREPFEARKRRYSHISVRNPLIMRQELCTNVTSERMICWSPTVQGDSRIVRVWFEMDNVHIDFHTIKNKPFIYHSNPDLFQLNSEAPGMAIRFKPGGVLAVEGKGLTLAMSREEVLAQLGDKECDVKTLDNTHLYCEPPEEQPVPVGDKKLPSLKVLMGKLEFDLGPVQYDNHLHSPVPLAAQVGLAAGAAVVVLIVLVIILMYRRKSKQALRDYKKVLVQLETLEINVGDQCRKEFTDLMTEMMDLSSDVGGPGIPFLDYRTYAERVFFPGQKGAPLSQNLDLPDSRRQTVVQGLGQLNNLLNNRLFLIRFIHTLEAQQSFSQRDRGYVASLLTMALHDKLEYFTDVMKTLLGDLVQQYVAKNPKLMLRRTETVVEKMLTNWMSICLYSFLKEVAGEPLYKLYRAIKYQVDKGPVDAVTGKAKRTLNDSHLLREDIDYCSITLTVLVKSGVEVQPCPVKVLDSDTITQVKDKILDQIYKGAPYSQRPAADSLDLEWRSGQAGHLTLSDDDVTAIVQGRWKRINTLQHYKVPDGATVALIPRSQSSLGVNQVYQTGEKTPILEGEEEEGLRLWHLVKPSEDSEIPKHRKSSMRERERAKAIPEIYLTRLLSMKGTLQKFVDDVFVAILSTKRPPPIAVRFFFDFLDDMAEKHGIDDPETVHIWKTNSLPLRFWVNILKNPQFVFDVQVTDSVDAVLSVIAQTFIDSCTTSEHKVGRDSPVNKLLYAREIPRYKQLVERYYSDIHNAVSGCYQEMNSTLTELSGSFASEMNSLVALHELYKYINKYYDQVIMSLEEDAAGQKMQLAYRLQQVAALVENKVTDL